MDRAAFGAKIKELVASGVPRDEAVRMAARDRKAARDAAKAPEGTTTPALDKFRMKMGDCGKCH